MLNHFIRRFKLKQKNVQIPYFRKQIMQNNTNCNKTLKQKTTKRQKRVTKVAVA